VCTPAMISGPKGKARRLVSDQWRQFNLIISSVVVVALHWFLFPLVSLSTGELKPRGTFFEHKDLLPHFTSSSSFSPRAFDFAVGSEKETSSVCDIFENLGHPCIWHGASLVWSYVTPSFVDDAEEVIVIVASHKECESASALDTNFRRLASFQNHLQDSRWLAKTVVLLVPMGGNSDGALEAWLNLYLVSSVGQQHRTMMPVSGTIRAALAVNFACPSGLQGGYDINLAVVGERGRLPNADLVNLASHSFRGLAKIEQSAGSESTSYWRRLTSLLGFCQAMLREPAGYHHVFLNAGIDALSVEAEPSLAGRSASAEDILRAVETMIRSLNHCEQRLSHGFYLFALLGPNFFVSIGEWGITLAIMIIPFVAVGLPLFRRMRCIFPTWISLLLSFSATLAGLKFSASISVSFMVALVTGWLVVPNLMNRYFCVDMCPAANAFHALVVLCCTVTALGAQNIATAAFGLSAAIGLVVILTHRCLNPSSKGLACVAFVVFGGRAVSFAPAVAPQIQLAMLVCGCCLLPTLYSPK